VFGNSLVCVRPLLPYSKTYFYSIGKGEGEGRGKGGERREAFLLLTHHFIQRTRGGICC